eukprot:scaffold72910_cov21-Phaeocystis_antarctica.AAC.1
MVGVRVGVRSTLLSRMVGVRARGRRAPCCRGWRRGRVAPWHARRSARAAPPARPAAARARPRRSLAGAAPGSGSGWGW